MTDRIALEFDLIQRWRLILGRAAEEPLAQNRPPGTQSLLTQEMTEIDDTLGTVYDSPHTGTRSAGLAKGQVHVTRWLGDLKKHFDRDLLTTIQNDAIERNESLRAVLLEPEVLSSITPSLEMVATVLSLKSLIPEASKSAARALVSKVVEDIERRLKLAIERAVFGALDRSRHQPQACFANVDWTRTIRLNLQHFDPARKKLIARRFHFWSRLRRRREFRVIVCMDQSGSMADSVIYGSVMAAIFASIPSIETRLVAFDTEVVDWTEHLQDPVDVLFGVQLGGGTDIHRAVSYCQQFVHEPQKTIFILISDLMEGGDAHSLVQKMEALAASGVRTFCLLTLSDSGTPVYNQWLARRLAAVSVPSFACTPALLPEALEALFRGESLTAIAARYDRNHHATT